MNAPAYKRIYSARRGHCFTNALQFAARNRAWDIVHGIPLGRGPIDGVRFAHAWNEITHEGVRWVYDAYNDVLMPAELFYLLGAIRYTITYTVDAAAEKLDETDHAGPWDEKINQAR